MFSLLVLKGSEHTKQTKWEDVSTSLFANWSWPKAHLERGRERWVSTATENIHNNTFHQYYKEDIQEINDLTTYINCFISINLKVLQLFFFSYTWWRNRHFYRSRLFLTPTTRWETESWYRWFKGCWHLSSRCRHCQNSNHAPFNVLCYFFFV